MLKHTIKPATAIKSDHRFFYYHTVMYITPDRSELHQHLCQSG